MARLLSDTCRSSRPLCTALLRRALTFELGRPTAPPSTLLARADLSGRIGRATKQMSLDIRSWPGRVVPQTWRQKPVVQLLAEATTGRAGRPTGSGRAGCSLERPTSVSQGPMCSARICSGGTPLSRRSADCRDRIGQQPARSCRSSLRGGRQYGAHSARSKTFSMDGSAAVI